MSELEHRKELESKIIEKALKDQEFRESLLTNSKATLEKELGTKFPEGIEIKVLEETENTLYLVLPPSPIPKGTELSDEQLEAVAGGSKSDGWTCQCGPCPGGGSY